ncbi:BlaR1 peptidase M56 [Sporobacter termitidis DSM 10068]|uniref:BlaR1 peptidase M56 n=2 Tax=Sporobacter TaxID=44748 RepID=A0A1M5YTK7_9FIRM|nr:BlaR1 peptidase M56 [Sporobacter termitidis DSM 10068]
MDISQNISFMVCKKIQTPMMTGFFRPAILLPREDYDDTTLSAVIRHELMHCRRFDIWYKLLLRLVRAVHWFNPLVWLMVRTAESDMEASCDEAVIGKRDLNFRLQYCEAVLATVQAQNIKNNTFSTGFSGGKNSMKKRFANILNTSRKSKGKVALCLSALVIFASGTLVACNEQGKPSVSNWFDQASFAPGTVNAINAAGEPVMSYNAGNTYVLDGQGNVILTYNDETMVKAPLTLNVSELYKPGLEMPDTGFYVSAQKTAIAYGGDNEPIQVLVSDDKGATWNTYAVDNSDNSRAAKFIGFITQDDGYLVASPGSALGTSKNFVYLTSDGGKTWKETGNPNDLHSRNMTGAGFSSKDIGFIGFRVDDAVGPTIYWTQDQGKTWAKFDMKMPGQFDGYYKTPMSPVFSGNEGLWPISLRKGDDMSTIYMTSEDYGKTWRYDDSLLSKGQSISYTLITENQDFARPTYSSAWDDPLYKEQFPDASTREEVAKHMIFEMPIGAATSYPFYVDLGLDKENLNYSPNPDNIGIIIFNSRIKSVKVLGSKVAVIAAPADTGYQVIMLKRDDLPKTEAQISLMTPDGRVLDYLNMQ